MRSPYFVSLLCTRFRNCSVSDATGIVASIAEPLARDGFSVLYISMYNSDLILVEEDQLAPALASVEQALQKIKDLNNPASLLPDLAKLVATSPAPAPSLLSAHTAPKIGAAAAVKKAPVPLTSVEFSVVSAKLQLGWLRKADVKRTCYSLMRLFLRPSSPERFFSFTLAADEVSIVLAEEDFTEIKSEETHIAWHPESWCAMEASVRNPKISTSSACTAVTLNLITLQRQHSSCLPSRRHSRTTASLCSTWALSRVTSLWCVGLTMSLLTYTTNRCYIVMLIVQSTCSTSISTHNR